MDYLNQAISETYSLNQLVEIRTQKIKELENLRQVATTSTGAGLSVATEKIMNLTDYIEVIQSIINLKKTYGDKLPEYLFENNNTTPVWGGFTQF